MKTYRCYFQNFESEWLDIKEIFYMIKEYYFIELGLDNWLYIRQRKDVPMTYDTEDKSFDMKHWTVYLTDWDNIYDVWKWWWEDELQKRIEECEKR